MTTELPGAAAAYVRWINHHAASAFIALFADSAVVNDVGREFRDLDAIKEWSEKEIFAPLVTLKVIGVADRGAETVLTTRVEGNFDRTGLPDPVIINHAIRADAGRIVSLTCRLAVERHES